MSVLLFFLISYVLLSIALYFVFPKCGVSAVKGLIPGVNFMEWCTIIGRPKWWAALLLIPILNFFIFVGMAVDLMRSFGKLQFKHTAAAFLYAPAAIGYLGFKKEAEYLGPAVTDEKAYNQSILDAKAEGNQRKLQKLFEKNPYKKSGVREWVESVVFAVFAAAFIRMFFVEAYVIPTPSMEGSLNVGDFLFVSKASYGIRTPMTVAMIPLLHNRIPIVNTESYVKKPSLPYFRLPAIRDIKRNSPFVFNWPVGDSVYVTAQRPYTVAQVARNPAFMQNDSELRRKIQNKDIITRPIDKKDHYIKRCVAVAGDTLHIRNKQIFINGKKTRNPNHLQYLYRVQIPTGLNIKKFEEWGIDQADIAGGSKLGGNGYYFLDSLQVEQLRSMDENIGISVHPNKVEPDKLFPHDRANFPKWSVDNYGPIWIPKAGVTIDIDSKNIALYRKLIADYEHNALEITNGQIKINGKVANSYTFKQNYYWAMGDNRHNSEDSRAWGFVPHDHIVGKPLFIWFSTKDGSISNGINWDRIFMSADAD